SGDRPEDWLDREAAVARALRHQKPGALGALPAPRGPVPGTGPGQREPAASPTRKGGETAG
ncbi:hypothetical protein AB0F45_26435, partial [Streptomyces achromogenes]|uniref:hypothetical protein n=1 Tax=Streptomyces achromogenes TaxID=67255 RepID=UPI003411C8BB